MSEPAAQVVNFPDTAVLAEAAAQCIVTAAQTAIGDHGYFAWALSGGNTPVATYRLLTQSPWIEQIDWSCTHVFFADERFVAHDHLDSNCLLVRENLLQYLPQANLHAVPVDGTPEQAAAAYARDIQAFFAPAPPRFDLVTLGMGPDGHTASLFPGMDDCGDALVAAIHGSPKPPPVRITLTYRLLNQARNVVFIVTGQDKAALVDEVSSLPPVADFPAGKIVTPERSVVWLACTH